MFRLFASALPPELTSQLDKSMRVDLDAWSNWWFWILVGSTIAVVIGIICEAPEVWQAISFGRKAVQKMDDLNGWERLCPELLAKNDRPRKWIAAIGLVGWTFVALGVAGEGVAEYFVNDAETGIRAFDEASLSETTRTAGDAKTSAQRAATAARAAESASAILQEQILEMGARDRLLSGSRADTVVKALKQFHGQWVRVAGGQSNQYPTSDPEVLDTASCLRELLSEAKWEVQPEKQQQQGFAWITGKGIWVAVPACASPRTVLAEKALVRALERAPVMVEPHEFGIPKTPCDRVFVSVMTNPEQSSHNAPTPFPAAILSSQ